MWCSSDRFHLEESLTWNLQDVLQWSMAGLQIILSFNFVIAFLIYWPKQPREGSKGKRNYFTYASLLGICITPSLATFVLKNYQQKLPLHNTGFNPRMFQASLYLKIMVYYFLDFANSPTTDLRSKPASQEMVTVSGWSIWRLTIMIYEHLGKEEKWASDAFQQY